MMAHPTYLLRSVYLLPALPWPLRCTVVSRHSDEKADASVGIPRHALWCIFVDGPLQEPPYQSAPDPCVRCSISAGAIMVWTVKRHYGGLRSENHVFAGTEEWNCKLGVCWSMLFCTYADRASSPVRVGPALPGSVTGRASSAKPLEVNMVILSSIQDNGHL